MQVRYTQKYIEKSVVAVLVALRSGKTMSLGVQKHRLLCGNITFEEVVWNAAYRCVTIVGIFGTQSDLYLCGLAMYIYVPVINLRDFWCFRLVPCKRD